MEYSDTLGIGSSLVDDYEIVRVLGTGGFGNTYLAIDRNLNREVAIKEFYPRGVAVREHQTTVQVKSNRFESSFQWGLERFVQEARVLAKFRHPNIVRVFRTFDANNTSYIVLDYVRGTDLEGWLRALRRRPTQQEMDDLVAPLADALGLVHAAGVLHRDIKPENICVREETGDPVLLDFGSSKYQMGEMTGTTAAIVSRGYSPYEAYAADSKSQGAWTDIYGLGATIHRALMDAAPPEATERVLEDSYTPLASQGLEGFRPEFLAAVDWALSVQPSSRPQNVAEWRARLFAGGQTETRGWQTTSLLLNPATGGVAGGDRTKASRAQPTGGTGAAAPRRRSRLASASLYLGGVVVLAGAGLVSAAQLGLIDQDLWARWLPRPSEPAATAISSPPEASETRTTAAARPQRSDESAPAAKTAEASPPAMPPEERQLKAAVQPLVYRNRVYGSDGGSRVLTVAAVSPDGQRIVAGALDGSLRAWNVQSGDEVQIDGPNGVPVLAVEFAGAREPTLFAARGDGSILSWAPDQPSSRMLAVPALSGTLIRALGFSAVTDGLVAVATGQGRTLVARWTRDTQAPPTVFDAGRFMVRAAAVARLADLAVVVRQDETLAAFRYSNGHSRADVVAAIRPAQDWTRALAVTDDGDLLARGGHYPVVNVLGLGGKRPNLDITLGEQAQTRSLAFAADGKRLAIDYQVVVDMVTQSRIRVVSLDDGQVVADVESTAGPVRWVSFMPTNGELYWLAATLAGNIRVCQTGKTCDNGGLTR